MSEEEDDIVAMPEEVMIKKEIDSDNEAPVEIQVEVEPFMPEYESVQQELASLFNSSRLPPPFRFKPKPKGAGPRDPLPDVSRGAKKKRNLKRNYNNPMRLDKPYFECDECGKVYSAKCHLQRHVFIHFNIKPFRCLFCPKAFVYGDRLREHMRVHTGEKPFACPRCPQTFRHRGNLRSHIMTHEGIRKYQCDVCLKTFTHDSGLRCHKRTHLEEKPFECKICNKSFRRNTNLREHQKIHSGMRPHICHICNKNFTQRSGLREHLKIHSGVKPFKCEICEKYFVCRKLLSSHMRKHNGMRYPCDICKKMFVSKSYLKKHIVVHTNESPYACNLCDKKYKYPSNYNMHMKEHAKNEGKTFPKKEQSSNSTQTSQAGSRELRDVGVQNPFLNPPLCEELGAADPISTAGASDLSSKAMLETAVNMIQNCNPEVFNQIQESKNHSPSFPDAKIFQPTHAQEFKAVQSMNQIPDSKYFQQNLEHIQRNSEQLGSMSSAHMANYFANSPFANPLGFPSALNLMPSNSGFLNPVLHGFLNSGIMKPES